MLDSRSMPIRTEKRSERRARILAAAGDLFAERGADAVSGADVARAAGVSRATVFNHFGSKRALLEGNVSRAKRKKTIDRVAAALILQGYLDSKRES